MTKLLVGWVLANIQTHPMLLEIGKTEFLILEALPLKTQLIESLFAGARQKYASQVF